MKHRLCVAHFAAIVIGICFELGLVGVWMTSLACGCPQRILRIGTGRFVALSALNRRMSALQDEPALLMAFERKQGWFEALLVVATGAIAAGAPISELSLVSVLVAIRAQSISDRLAEIATLVALKTSCFAVFAQQREFRAAVVEAHTVPQRLPVRRFVTRLAIALERSVGERSLVRVDVTSVAGREFEAAIRNFIVPRPRLMTARAGDPLVPPRQRVGTLAMIEATGGFPGVLRMAVLTLRAELPFVGIVLPVTSGALGR